MAELRVWVRVCDGNVCLQVLFEGVEARWRAPWWMAGGQVPGKGSCPLLCTDPASRLDL